MQTMTANEYLKFALLRAVTRLAEKEGVRIIDDEKPRPRLVTKEGTVVMLRTEEEEI